MVKIEVTPQSGVTRELLSLLAALPRDQLPLYLPWLEPAPAQDQVLACRFPWPLSPQQGRSSFHLGVQGRGRWASGFPGGAGEFQA